LHPAPSIIVFSTLSGAGFGLLALAAHGFVGAGAADVAAVLLGMALASAGLVASTFHLGRPERALLALTQWRSSWLSREGLFAVGALGMSLLALAARLWGPAVLVVLFGLPASLLSIATIYATAMIYAQLKTVPRWRTSLTPACYLLFSGASGALLAALLASLFGEGRTWLVAAALALLLVAWGVKLAWWARAARTPLGTGGSPESATGLGRLGRVSLFEPPHTSPNYLTKEMVFRVGRRHAAKLRVIALVLGAALPLALAALSLLVSPAWPFLMLAALLHLIGVAVERWLFFAEAEHVVAFYYGHR